MLGYGFLFIVFLLFVPCFGVCCLWCVASCLLCVVRCLLFICVCCWLVGLVVSCGVLLFVVYCSLIIDG